MQPRIAGTRFGSITVEGREFDFDIVIDLAGNVRKRRKKLSKKLYDTSHLLSRDEAEDVYQQGAEALIVGSGQQGVLELSPEAQEYLRGRRCKVQVLPTPQAAEAWNRASGKVIALFHVTC